MEHPRRNSPPIVANGLEPASWQAFVPPMFEAYRVAPIRPKTPPSLELACSAPPAW